MGNSYHRPSELMIEATYKNGKTVMSDVFFTAPYKVMNPFYINKDYMTIMAMSASSGIMAGDTQLFRFNVNDGAKMEFISQEYEKIHKMESGHASRNTMIKIGKEAYMYYNPLPTIPFKDSAYKSNVTVHLTDGTSRFIMKEILCSGRSLRGENFEYQYYHNLIQVYLGGELIYRDNTKYEPDHMDIASIGMYEHYTHLGNLLIFNLDSSKDFIEKTRVLLSEVENIDGGITSIDDTAVIVRVLGHGSESINHLLDQILEL